MTSTDITPKFSMLDADDRKKLVANFESRWIEVVDYVVSHYSISIESLYTHICFVWINADGAVVS